MPDEVAPVQVLPPWQAERTEVRVPGASVWPLPSEKLVAEMVRFQPAPEPRASTTPRSGAYEAVWSVPSRVLVIEGFEGRFRLTPAVPLTWAVAVSVPAKAAVVATRATAATAREMMMRCLM